MNVVKLLSAAGIAVAVSVASAWSVTFDEINGPAEYPPPGFGGSQYVDSAGCVFMRAGYAGQVTWVPRVTRDRQVICGQTPTFGRGGAGLPVVADAAVPAPAPRAERVGPPMQTIAGITAAPRVRATAPAPSTVDPRSYTPAPVAVARPAVQAKPVASPAREVRGTVLQKGWPAGQTACPNRDLVAQRFMLADGRHAIRCVPQSEYPKTYVDAATAAALPQGVAPAPVTIPPGYKPAWEDDRLNPMRGVGTATGEAQMRQVWTDQVPMRAAQPVRVVRYVPAAPAPAPAQRVTVSSRNAPAAKTPAAAPAAGGRYVQVGAFGVAANAEAAGARLRAAGLPVAVSRSRGMQVVLAGPVAAEALPQVLATARRAGFGDAFVR